MELLVSVLIGLVAGVLSGMFGVGGGVVIVPALVWLLGYSFKEATGTSLLTLLLPVGILAVLTHAQAGHIHVKVGLMIGLGLFAGALVGAQISLGQTETLLRRLFAVLLAATAVRMFVTA